MLWFLKKEKRVKIFVSFSRPFVSLVVHWFLKRKHVVALPMLSQEKIRAYVERSLLVYFVLRRRDNKLRIIAAQGLFVALLFD